MKKYHGGEDGVEGLERGLWDVDQRRVPPHPRFLPHRNVFKAHKPCITQL